MHDETDFLNKLLESPTDDTVRLVFADWLDERGDDESKLKATFLRMTAQLLAPERTAKWRQAFRKEMQPLAAKLPTDWLAVVSRLQIDHCGAKMAGASRAEWLHRQFEFVCEQGWDEMTPTDDDTVRHCERCKENVHYCDTIVVARAHARLGHCVAVDLGVIRRENDVSCPPATVRGRMLPPRPGTGSRRVDAVSREREARKRQQNAGDAVTAPS